MECEGGAHAEGMARAEYSTVGTWEDNAYCSEQGAGSPVGGSAGTGWYLIQRDKGQTSVMDVTILAWSTYPRGGQSRFDRN